MNRLIAENLVAKIKLIVPRLRFVVIENRHPALGESEAIKIPGELRKGLLAREVAQYSYLL